MREGSQTNVLIVEDEQSFRYSLSLVLKSAGIHVGEASSGEEALHRIFKPGKISQKIDLLILDIQLPGISGLEVIDELNRKECKIPVLIISGTIRNSQIAELRSKGCIGLLPKPFSPDQLLETVHLLMLDQHQSHTAVLKC